MKTSAPLSHAETARLTFAITAISVATASFLALIKLWGWWRGGSVALLASLADSALDVFAALATFIAVRIAATPPDAEHRFGHGKAEAFASLLQGGVVFASAALVGQEAVVHLISGAAISDEGAGLLIMAVSTAATVALVTAQSRILARTRSVAVSGDHAHYLADLVSNVAAFIGLGLARLTDNSRWDAAAGLIGALWLLRGAFKVFRGAADHLMDRELDDVERQRIIDCVLRDPKVLGVHALRTHASGPSVHIQMHIDLVPDQTLEAAHRIVEAAEERLLLVFPTADVVIHPDPAGHAERAASFGEERASTRA